MPDIKAEDAPLVGPPRPRMTTTEKFLFVALVLLLAICILQLLYPGYVAKHYMDPLNIGPSRANIDALADTPDAAYIRFGIGVLGAVTLGWSVTLLSLLVGGNGLRFAPQWRAAALGVGSWFVLDSVFSISVGVAVNAALNLVFALPLLVPLFVMKQRS